MPACAVIGVVVASRLLNKLLPASGRLGRGQLTFELSDALLRVVIDHQQMVPRRRDEILDLVPLFGNDGCCGLYRPIQPGGPGALAIT